MTAAIPSEARFKPRNLLGIILFLRKYPGPVGLCLSLLLVNIGIEMALPQIIGDTITNLRRAVTANVAFSPGFHVKLLVAHPRSATFAAPFITPSKGWPSPITTRPTLVN